MESSKNRCFVCDSTDLKRSDLVVQGRYGLMHCRHCGLSFLDLNPGDTSEESFDDYWSSVNEEIYTNPDVIAELQEKYTRLFRRIAGGVSNKRRWDRWQ